MMDGTEKLMKTMEDGWYTETAGVCVHRRIGAWRILPIIIVACFRKKHHLVADGARNVHV